MKRPVVAVDVDDVLALHAAAFVAFSNAQYGTNLKIEDYTDHWAEMWQVDTEEIERRAREFHTPEHAIKYELIEGSKDALEKLAEKFDLVIVSARREWLLDVSREWLQKYFPGVFKETHFVPIWEPNNTVTKADICKRVGADYLIDDLPGHCNLVAQSGMKALLFGDYKWNRDDPIEPGVTRVKDWQAVLDYFDARG